MSGETKGTGRGLKGTSGGLSLSLFATIAVFVTVVATVNATSVLMENPSGHRPFAAWEPVVWEGSSNLVVLALVPLIYVAYSRFHFTRLGVPRFLLAQAFCAIIFSLLHVAGMATLRQVAYSLAGRSDHFFHDNVFLRLIYEGRKDWLAYAIISAFFWVDERLRDLKKSTPEALPERIEVKTDGRTLYLAPAGIIYAEAAGNYVEMHLALAAKPLLLRGTLSAFETQLKPYGFVRIHRSRLLNRGHMASHSGTPSGDIRIVLSDGRELSGSRRYRGNL